MKCKCRCGYEWESRVPEPKECPQCKTRKNNGKRFAVEAREASGARLLQVNKPNDEVHDVASRR